MDSVNNLVAVLNNLLENCYNQEGIERFLTNSSNTLEDKAKEIMRNCVAMDAAAKEMVVLIKYFKETNLNAYVFFQLQEATVIAYKATQEVIEQKHIALKLCEAAKSKAVLEQQKEDEDAAKSYRKITDLLYEIDKLNQ
jgi:hypothetical protein